MLKIKRKPMRHGRNPVLIHFPAVPWEWNYDDLVAACGMDPLAAKLNPFRLWC